MTRKKWKTWQKFLLITGVLSLILITVGVGALYFYYHRMDIVKTDESKLGLDEDHSILGNNYVNIALYGIDSRDVTQDSGSRSDSIMIASLDKKNKKLRLGSVVRDTYVAIDGHGMDKINHAYAFGGPELAMKTLNQNFGVNVTRFVVVNFYVLADIIDTIGGVTVEVDDAEFQLINKYIKEIARIEGKTPTLVKTTGTQKLNGMQAVAYARIRKTAGGDFKRSERQREVILAIATKVQDRSVPQLISLGNKILPEVKTNLGMNEMISLLTEVSTGGYDTNVQQQMFPSEEYSKGQKIDGVYYYVTDLPRAREDMKAFFLGTTSETESKTTTP